MNLEHFARTYSYSVVLSRRLERGADGLAYIVGEKLCLDELGGVTPERFRHLHPDQLAGYVVRCWDELPPAARRGRRPADLPARPGTFYRPDEIDWEMRWALRPEYRPFGAEEFARAAEKLAAVENGTFTLWPSPLYAGRVALAGSRDRWVIGCDIGGYLTFLRGTYRSAQDAEAALRAELARRQARVAELLAARCAPYPVRCAFPPITIEVIGDTGIVCDDLSNRRTRRQAHGAA